ncbi:MAG TPA: amino acid ABC transporter ATP-binding protein [Acetobacteraceae bacterium]|nr:amino acid ABC transporter ATP-binding protein [Acetobacteraceae bacterium]
MPYLELADVSAAYGSKPVLAGVSLALERGEIASLIGPSGSGKSTLLRVLVGLLVPSSGEVRLDGQPVDLQQPASIRDLRNRFAIVFQQYNLFMNMTALRNVMIAPLKVKHWPREEVERDARRLLTQVGLGDKLNAYPDQLSGGQQQRVALARALALRPEVLLLDEVTSALDPELVTEVLDAIRLLAAEGMTMLVVSHEMGFVREVSSQVVFMADGRSIESGPPRQIFDDPQTQRARDFVAKIIRH